VLFRSHNKKFSACAVEGIKSLIKLGKTNVTNMLIAIATIPLFKRNALNSLLNFLVD